MQCTLKHRFRETLHAELQLADVVFRPKEMRQLVADGQVDHDSLLDSGGGQLHISSNEQDLNSFYTP